MEPRYDVAIIGAGIVGCAVAYELAKTDARTLLLERSNDVAAGATRANSGILHAGYDPLPGTYMARYNVRGNALSRRLAQELGVPCRTCGSLVLALRPADMPTLGTLYDRGRENGVPGLELLDAAQVRAREPHLTDEVVGALYAPTAAVVSPWEMAIALADTAAVNGCDLRFGCEVTAIDREADGFRLVTAGGVFHARRVVNAAGTHADIIHDLVAAPAFTIRPSRGEYYLLDKSQGYLAHNVLFQCPTEKGKGVLAAPTAHGNLIAGPTAVDSPDPDDTGVSAEGLAEVSAQVRRLLPALRLQDNIRNFAGVRANSDQADFIIGEAPGCPGFIDLAGIKSPGLTSAPAIAEACVDLLDDSGLHLNPCTEFRLYPRPTPFRELDGAARDALIRENPLFGRVICRCETVTEGEIVRAIHAPVPARSIDAVKRRCQAGMGRCQGGFCGPRVAAILARELAVPMTAVLQDRPGTEILTGATKEGRGA